MDDRANQCLILLGIVDLYGGIRIFLPPITRVRRHIACIRRRGAATGEDEVSHVVAGVPDQSVLWQLSSMSSDSAPDISPEKVSRAKLVVLSLGQPLNQCGRKNRMSRSSVIGDGFVGSAS